MQKLALCLWFDSNAEEAVLFYTSVFKNSKVVSISRYGEAGAEVSGQPEGSVMSVAFEIEGRDFLALNGGPEFSFSPAISIMVNCETQEEVDGYWDKLTEGGEILECGWLTDKFGVTWQIIPTALDEMLQDPDTRKAERVMRAMIQMKKLDLAALKMAYEEE